MFPLYFRPIGISHLGRILCSKGRPCPPPSERPSAPMRTQAVPPLRNRPEFPTFIDQFKREIPMKKTLSLFAGALFWIFPATAQIPEAQPLYPQGAPDNNGLPADKAVYAESHAEKIAEADYMLFRADPSKATGQAVVICPGGAYLGVAYTHEGIQVAQWMNERGITALMLRYRMPNGHHDIPLHDARTAIALLRNHAAEWGIDPHQVGIMGFSAGGHLASTVSTHFENDS